MKRILLAVFAIFILCSPAMAARYDIVIGEDVPDQTFRSFIREAGTLSAYRGLAPAAPQGVTGFDIGLAVSAVDLRDENWDVLLRGSAPDYLAVPRVQLRKGLPFNLDVGGFFAMVPSSNIRLWGGELQWAALDGGLTLPAVALRGHFSSLEGVSDLDLLTYGADLVVSKGFALLTPYAGIGVVRIEGEYAGDNPTVRANLSDHNFTEPRYFVGLQGALALLRIVAEAEYLDRPVYSLKISAGW